MPKEKKITAKYFPRPALSDEIPTYSVYIRVTYNRKSTMFSTGELINTDSLVEAKRLLDNAHEFTNLNSTSVIVPLIRREIEIIGDKYSITGFGDRWTYYNMPILYSLNRALNEQILEKLKDMLTFRQYHEMLLLIPNLDNRITFNLYSSDSTQDFNKLKKFLNKKGISFKKVLSKDIVELLYAVRIWDAFIKYEENESYRIEQQMKSGRLSKDEIEMLAVKKQIIEVRIRNYYSNIANWILHQSFISCRIEEFVEGNTEIIEEILLEEIPQSVFSNYPYSEFLMTIDLTIMKHLNTLLSIAKE